MSTIRGNHIVTHIPTITYTLKWSIDKFAKLLCEETVTSPDFFPIAGKKCYSELTKFSSGVTWVIFYDSQISVHVHHDIIVFDHKGTVLFEKLFSSDYSCPNGIMSCCYLIKSTDKTLLNNDCDHEITFVCHMTLREDKIKSKITEIQSGIPDSVHNLKNLSGDLKTMYEVSLYSDICLKVDGTILRAHRALLCARSPVFAKMFEHELNEKETNEINITDLETDVLKQLISFLYTGIVLDESFDSVFTLYYAADKYDVTDLRQRCGDILMAKINVDNACRVLALAERHSDDSLKKSAIGFVETYLKPIFATEGWKELLKEKTSLAAEVLYGYTEKRSPQKETKVEKK